jgi:hypothetical protein
MDEGRICKAPFSVHNATSRKANASATGTAAIARGSMAFDCAWTANTIARIAGKLAKSAWSNPMTDEPVRTVFHLDKDSRLVSVFCSAVEHQAAHAGLESGAGAQFAQAAGDVCREAISQGAVEDHGIDVTLDTFRDRMEVAIHYRGKALPTTESGSGATMGAMSKGAESLKGQELLARVDRVHCHADEGIARVTLVKFLPAHH